MRTVIADKDAEMLTVLSPGEKFEYELRPSQSAILLRMNLGEFEPTEPEFRQMFQTAKTLADRCGVGVLTRMESGQAGDAFRARRCWQVAPPPLLRASATKRV